MAETLREQVIRQLVERHGWDRDEAERGAADFRGKVDAVAGTTAAELARDLADIICASRDPWTVGPLVGVGIQVLHPLRGGPLVCEPRQGCKVTEAELRLAEHVVAACNRLPRLVAALDAVFPADNWQEALEETANKADGDLTVVTLTTTAGELHRLYGALERARKQ